MRSMQCSCTRERRAKRSHPPRERRDCLGQLVQIDGCEHAWFEKRAPSCTLLVYVLRAAAGSLSSGVR